MSEETRAGGDLTDGNVEGAQGSLSAIGKDNEQNSSTGNVGNVVNVYTEMPSRSRRRRQASDMTATIEEHLIAKINELELKIAKLELYREADKQTVLDYKHGLEEDLKEMRAAIRPLRGLDILAAPSTTTTQPLNFWAVAAPTIMMYAIALLAIAGIIALFYLTVAGRL